MSSTAGAVANPPISRGLVPVERHFLNAAIGTVFTLFVLLSLVLLLRRLSGAFVQPLGSTQLTAAAVALGIVAAGLRWAIAEGGLPRSLVRSASNEALHPVPSTQYAVLRTPYLGLTPALVIFAIPGIAGILWLSSLTLPGTPAVGVIAAWFLLIALEAASWLTLYRAGHVVFLHPPPQPSPLVSPEPEETETPIQAGLVQQLTRVREEGRESIHALLRAEIPAGDRLTILHIAFCPPLDAQPELAAHALDTDDAEVRITQAETFGTRLEVSVTRPVTEGRSIVVEVVGAVTSPECA
jgi:hypothetical protein